MAATTYATLAAIFEADRELYAETCKAGHALYEGWPERFALCDAVKSRGVGAEAIAEARARSARMGR